jgi:Putative zinc-finger
MTCEEFEARLTAFSLAELDEPEMDAARRHVAQCDDCARSVLRDRQLTALLRASAAQAPAAVREGVLAAIAAEQRADADEPHAEPARRSGRRRRHWLALTAAAGAAAAVLATALLVVPAPDRSAPLTAAWAAYRNEPVLHWQAPTGRTLQRLDRELGAAAATPDLSADGLVPRGWGARMLAGHLAAVVEYRDVTGHRVALIRWRGRAPSPAKGGPAAGREVATVQWDGTGSEWWDDQGVVYCLIGTVDPAMLHQIADQLRHETGGS